MDIYRVSFIGHREVDDFFFVEDQVDSVVRELINSKEYVEFYVGRNGEFDTIVASVIKRAKRELGEHNSSLILVIPYPVADMEAYENYYDEVEYPRELHKVHYKSAIKLCNKVVAELLRSLDRVYFKITNTSKGEQKMKNYQTNSNRKVVF